ncbi:MAG TPA: hypothetical protein VFQ65_21300 [Kofleriaceae bacterium]|nr:hypothetical protein [Kofleriaceae bacterium]
MRATFALLLLVACAQPAPPAPTPPAPPPPPAPHAARDFYVPEMVPELFPAPLAAGKLTTKKTAVILVQAWPRGGAGPDEFSPGDGYYFLPLVCSINGVLATGIACGEAMPAKAKVRTALGTLTVARETTPFRDEAGGQDYVAPYRPECCSYNTCLGKTVPYKAPYPPSRKERPPTLFAVWPEDADVGLEIAAGGVAPGVDRKLSIQPNDKVLQAFERQDRTYASVISDRNQSVMWRTGGAQIVASLDGRGPYGYAMLATSDVNHDGHLELVSYELWANDHGIAIFDEPSNKPLYHYSCGNI